MFKFVLCFFFTTSFVAITAFATITPNDSNSSSNDEAPIELFEEDEDSIPAFLENEDSEEEEDRVLKNEESSLLQYLCDGVTVFVTAQDRQWYDENCIPVIEE